MFLDILQTYGFFLSIIILVIFKYFQYLERIVPHYIKKTKKLKDDLIRTMVSNVPLQEKLQQFEKIKRECINFDNFQKVHPPTLLDPYLEITEKNYIDFYDELLKALNHYLGVLYTKRFHKDLY